MIAKMTPIEWFASEINGMDTAVSINAFKELFEKAKQLEKLKNHSEYMSGWYNGFNSKEIETKGLEESAIEWLVNELKESFGLKDMHVIEKAKQMFEQQIVISHINGQSEFDAQSFDGGNIKKAEHYYNETFKSR